MKYMLTGKMDRKAVANKMEKKGHTPTSQMREADIVVHGSEAGSTLDKAAEMAIRTISANRLSI